MRHTILGTLVSSLGMAVALAVPNARAQDIVTLTMPVIDAKIWHNANGLQIRDLSDDTDLDPLGLFVIADARVNEASAVGKIGLGEQARAKASGDYTADVEMWTEISVDDPQHRPVVKTRLRFATSAGAAPLPGDIPPGGVLNAWANGSVVIGPGDHTPMQLRLSDGKIVSQPNFVSELFMITATGWAGRGRSVDGDVYWTYNQCSAIIRLNGIPVLDRSGEGCSQESAGGRLDLTHAPGAYLMRTTVSARGGIAASDPIWEPHPDNPDVVITRHAPAGIPGPALGDTTPEELAARGIDPAPFVELGFFGAPVVSVQPVALDYGTVVLGSASDRTLVVRNVGTADLAVTALRLTGAGAFTFVAPPATPFTLASGATLDVTVRFAPAAAGFESATLDVESDDPGGATLEVPLAATGAVSPRGRDLAVVKLGAPEKVAHGGGTKKVVVRIQNRGAAPETITLASLGDGRTSGLVRLSAPVVDADGEDCAPAEIVLDAAKTLPKGTKTLKPRGQLGVIYRVTYACAAARPTKGKPAVPGDYSHSAIVFGIGDGHGADDTCPRPALGPEPGNLRLSDKGCGGSRGRARTGGAVLTNVE